MRRFVPLLLLLLAGFAIPPAAEGRTDRLMTYRENQVWTGVLRFLRVDMGFRVIERDREAGYLLFEYRDGGQSHNGSLELVPVVQSGRRYVRATLQIPNMPTYVEVVLFEKLERKLRSEYGDPPPPATATSPPAGPGDAPATAPAGDGDDAEESEEEE